MDHLIQDIEHVIARESSGRSNEHKALYDRLKMVEESNRTFQHEIGALFEQLKAEIGGIQSKVKQANKVS